MIRIQQKTPGIKSPGVFGFIRFQNPIFRIIALNKLTDLS